MHDSCSDRLHELDRLVRVRYSGCANRTQEKLLNERQRVVVELLVEGQDIGVRHLASRFEVSDMTIRRDLADLEKQGLVTRTHGGAVAVGRLRFLHSAFPHYRISAEKEAIGSLAAGLVSPGQTVMIDAGATPLEVAVHLPQNADITVATTSLCAAQALYGSPVTVLLLGGFLRRDFPSLYRTADRRYPA